MSSTAVFEPITVGDVRPVVVEVKPSDDAQIVSASYRIVRRNDDPSVIFDTGAACKVEKVRCGFRIATPTLIAFPTVDLYTVQFEITWDDGVIDNTVSAVIQVKPLKR